MNDEIRKRFKEINEINKMPSNDEIITHFCNNVIDYIWEKLFTDGIDRIILYTYIFEDETGPLMNDLFKTWNKGSLEIKLADYDYVSSYGSTLCEKAIDCNEADEIKEIFFPDKKNGNMGLYLLFKL